MKGVIYLATNKINGKVYIGKTIQALKKRRKAHEHDSLNNRSSFYFHNALRKHGLNNFKWEIIDHAKTEKELNLLEELYIADYREKRQIYNLNDGRPGRAGFTHSKATKRKMSKAKIGNKNNLGHKASEKTKKKMSEAHKDKKHTKESKEKMSIARSGENNAMYGKCVSKETREKMSEASKGCFHTEKTKRKISASLKKNPPMRGKRHTEETKMKMSEAHKGNQYCLGHKHTEEHKRKLSESLKIYNMKKRKNVDAEGVLSLDISINKENSERCNNAMAS